VLHDVAKVARTFHTYFKNVRYGVSFVAALAATTMSQSALGMGGNNTIITAPSSAAFGPPRSVPSTMESP